MINKVQKLFLLGLMIICGLSLSACSAEGANETTEFSSDTTENVSVSPEDEIDAEFGESFTLVPGKTFYIHSKDISFMLDKINHFQSGRSEAYYTLRINGAKYTGVGAWEDNNGSVKQVQSSSPLKVYIDGADTDQSATFRIEMEEPIKVPDPLILSGNPDDVYVTTKQEYVESDDIILFLSEGVTLYGDTMNLIDTIKNLVEKETGFKLKLETRLYYSEYPVNGVIEGLFGEGAFPGVDPDKKKTHIYIVPPEISSPCSMKGCVVLNPIDLDIAAGEGFAFVHELTHTAQMENGRLISTVMDEGYSTYITKQICDRDEIISFNFDSEYNYSGYEKEITKKNAEALFIEDVEDNWEKYLYGFRFMTYLFETYGNDIYRNILFDASTTYDSDVNITDDLMVPIVKEHTSETVFEDFAKWLSKNKDKFDGK